MHTNHANQPSNSVPQECELDFDFSLAFQPIVDVIDKTVFAQEALVRGKHRESASEVFKHVNQENRVWFDQSCREKAIKMASKLGVDCLLSLNFLSSPSYHDPDHCIRSTLAAAAECNFDIRKIIFEFRENEHTVEDSQLAFLLSHYQENGFHTAIDDVGASYNGQLNEHILKANYSKLDMSLVRHIDEDPERQTLVKEVISYLHDQGQTVIAEGVETKAEYLTLRNLGVRLFQGFYFALPSFEALSDVYWPD